MRTPPGEGPLTPSAARIWPAWCSSLALHLVLMIVLPLLWFTPQVRRGVSDDRPVGIVLAKQDQRKTEYFEEAVVETASQATSNRITPLPNASPADAAEIQLPSNITPGVAVPLPGMLPAGSGGGGARRVPTEIDATELLAAEARRREREAARGPVTELSLFGGAPAEGRSFLFLIDRSKSMGKQGLDALDAAEAELKDNLTKLEPRHQFQVMAYHHQCIYLGSPKLLPATPKNLSLMDGHLSGLAAFGATEHERAILAALYLKPDVLFLLTDGGDPVLTAGQRQRIRRVAAGRTSIHCLQFGWGPKQGERNFLERLAAENGGSYGYVDMSRYESKGDSR